MSAALFKREIKYGRYILPLCSYFSTLIPFNPQSCPSYADA